VIEREIYIYTEIDKHSEKRDSYVQGGRDIKRVRFRERKKERERERERKREREISL